MDFQLKCEDLSSSSSDVMIGNAMMEDGEGNECDDIESGNLSEAFLGFSPTSSPSQSIAHQIAMVVEEEIKRLATFQIKQETNKKSDYDQVHIKIENTAEDTEDKNDEATDNVVDAIIDGKSSSAFRVDELKQRLPSRGSSPTESVSSRGGVRRSVSVSSRDSKGSQKTAAGDFLSSSRYGTPFQQGWHRELLLRDGSFEVTYLHPSGLKLKSLREVSENLTPGLTSANFTFKSEPLNVSPEYETIIKESHTSVRKSSRTITPSSNYKIVEMREEELRKRSNSDSPMAPPPKRAKIVLKLNRTSVEMSDTKEGAVAVTRYKKSDESVPHHHPQAPRGPLRKITPGHMPSPSTEQTYHENKKPEPRSQKKKKKASVSEVRARKISEGGWDSEKSSCEEPRRVCNMECPKAMNEMPSLQCCVCVCLYHPQCVDIPQAQNMQSFVCKSCIGKPEARKRKIGADVTVSVVPAATLAPAPLPPMPASPPVAAIESIPQIVVSVNRRRFIMVPDLSTPPAVTPVNTSNHPAVQQPFLADVPSVSTDISPIKPEGASTKIPKQVIERDGAKYFMRNLCSGYTALLHVFEYLTAPERLRVANVCRLWRDIAQHENLWRVVQLKNITVKDWNAFAVSLLRRNTRQLDLRSISVEVDSAAYSVLPSIRSLKSLDLGRVPPRVLHAVIKECPFLEVCSALLVKDGEKDDSLSLDIFSGNHLLQELRICSQGGTTLKVSSVNLNPIATTLRSLALLSLTGWDTFELSSFQQLGNLTNLELGDCSTLPVDFPTYLCELKRLRRIRLENVTEPCPCTNIVEALSSLPELNDVELINIDVRSGFDEALAKLISVKTLLLIPTFVIQSATTTRLILQGVYFLHESLKKLTWVFTDELLKITELYNVKDDNQQTQGGSCVPVLTPIPTPEIKSENTAAFWTEIDDRLNAGNSQTITVVPLHDLHKMLKAALPNTDTQIRKVLLQNTNTSSELLEI